MVVEYVGRCRCVVIVYSVSKIYCFASVCGINITRVNKIKKIQKLTLSQLMWHLIFQLHPFDVMKLVRSCI